MQFFPYHFLTTALHAAGFHYDEFGKINWMKYEGVTPGMEALTKIRYKDKGTLANLFPEGDRVRVEFYEKAKSIAPGQEYAIRLLTIVPKDGALKKITLRLAEGASHGAIYDLSALK